MAVNQKGRTQQLYERSPNGPLQSPGLGALALSKGFYFGSAINAGYFGNLDYMKYVFNEISCATPESSMHPTSMQINGLGVFSFGQTDQELAACQSRGVVFRGHALIDCSGIPAWMNTAVTSAATALSVMTTQINGIMAHYKGQFKWVNVVNESIGFSGDGQGFQSHPFKTFLGTNPSTGYIATALKLTKAADPNVKVGLNFSGVENSSAPNAEALIRQQVYAACRAMVLAGTPLDWIGCEMHMGPTQSSSFVAADMITWLAQMANLGVKIHITELDRDDTTTGTLAARDATIAADVQALVVACLTNPALEVLQCWELSDRDSWLNRGFGHNPRSDNLLKRPTLLSWSYGPKTSYTDVRAAITAQRPVASLTVDHLVSFGTIPTVVNAPFVVTTSKVGTVSVSATTGGNPGSPGQNMPAGMTVVVNTGKINATGLLGALGGSLLPAQTNNGTLSVTGPTGITTIWTNEAPNTKDSSGFWAGNWVLPPNGATGLATIFDSTLNGGAEPLRLFTQPFSSPGTSELFAGCMITLSSNWNYAGVGEIKIFNPITNAPNNNHILTLTATGPTGVVATGASFPHLFLQGSAAGETAGYVPSGGSSAQVPSFVSTGSAYSPSAAAANFYTTIGQPTCLEMYVKSETVAGSSQDGILKVWVNNVLVYATTTGTSFNVCTNGLGWHNVGETNDFGGGSASQHPPGTQYIVRDQYWWATR